MFNRSLVNKTCEKLRKLDTCAILLYMAIYGIKKVFPFPSLCTKRSVTGICLKFLVHRLVGLQLVTICNVQTDIGQCPRFKHSYIVNRRMIFGHKDFFPFIKFVFRLQIFAEFKKSNLVCASVNTMRIVNTIYISCYSSTIF